MKRTTFALSKSRLEDVLLNRIRIARLPEPLREYRFAKHIGRRYAADFAWPLDQLLVEVEGGIFSGGRHTRGAGYEEDLNKYNLAALLGYRVLRFSERQITDGVAVQCIESALRNDGKGVERDRRPRSVPPVHAGR